MTVQAPKKIEIVEPKSPANTLDESIRTADSRVCVLEKDYEEALEGYNDVGRMK
jgi:hypothetical protein